MRSGRRAPTINQGDGRRASAICAILLLTGLPPVLADDGITLNVQHGPGAAEVTLSWVGGAPVFEILRSSQPGSLFNPASRMAETDGSTWVDLPPGAPIVYYMILSRGAGCPAGGSDCEGEPNDTPGFATDLTGRPFPISVQGSILSGQDVDYFRLHLTAGSLLRVTAAPQPGSSLDAAFEVLGAEATNLSYRRTGRGDGAAGSASRQVFVPVTGDYWLRLYDEGGASSPGGSYTVTIGAETPGSPVAVSVGSSTPGQVVDGAVAFFSVTPPAGPVQAAAVAKQLPTASQVDTLLTVWDPIGGRVIAEVDDSETATGPPLPTTDARVAWRAAAATSYWVLVDHAVIEPPGAVTTFRLDLSSVPVEGSTTEVNDRLSTSYPLTVPLGPFAASMRNTTSIDWDVYSVYLEPTAGTGVQMNGALVSGHEEYSYYVITDEAGRTRRLGIVDNNFLATQRFFAAPAGTYYIHATDYRYVAPGPTFPFRPQDAAGTTYSIDLTSTPSPVVELPAANPLSLSLAARGDSRWHRIAHPGDYLLLKAVRTSPDFVPALTLWMAPPAPQTLPLAPIAGLTSDTVGLVLDPGDYIIESNEMFGFTGSYSLQWQSVGLGPGRRNLTLESDTDTDSTLNDTCATADVIDGVPGAALGRLTGGDLDYYSVALTAGSVTVQSAAGGFDFVDTVLSLYRLSTGVPVLIAANDDEDAATGKYYARLTFNLPASEVYCLRVSGKTVGDAGSYSILVTQP